MDLRLFSIVLQYNAIFKQTKPIFRILNRNLVLSYKILGDGIEPDKPPVFIFHGLIGNKKQWEGIGKTVLNLTKRSVVAVDLRNHGDSPHVNSHKYEDQATDVLQLFEKLGVEQASVVGHSMGGKTAMCVALMAPFKITGVLVIDISPASTSQQYIQEYPKILAAMKAVDFRTQKKISEAKRAVKNQLKDLITDDFLMNAVLSNIKYKSDHTIGWSLNLDILIKHMKYIVSFPKCLRGKKYYGPTLFIGGQLSEFIPPDDLTEIRELFPKAVITYIPKTGHNVHVDDPRSFMEIAIAFIRTHRYKRPFKPLANPTPDSIPIIILHEVLGSKKNWESMCRKITVDLNRSVIAVDARNHGDSPHSNSHTYADLASDVSQLITNFSVSKATIIGHSMGGRTGMSLALTEPSKVASLVVIDISPISTSSVLSEFFPNLLDVMQSVNFEGLNDLHKAKNVAKDAIVKSGILDENMDGMQLLLMNIGKLPDKSFGWTYNLTALKTNYKNIASFPNLNGKRYKGPTLFIGGGLSNSLSYGDFSGILKLFPNAELKFVSGVGHIVHAEDPKAFFDMVITFLKINNA